MKYINLILPVLLASCSNNSERETHVEKDTITVQNKSKEVITDSNVYDDIDLFRLEGVGKIENPLSYPYIKIEVHGDSKKRIVYKRDAKDSVERVYEKKGRYWTTNYEQKGDTGYYRTYEYIADNKIIELIYDGTWQKQDYHLHDASLIQKDSMVSYGYYGDKGIAISPDANNIEIVKKNAKAIFTDKFHFKNGNLMITQSSFYKTENRFIYRDTFCYLTNNHSWFWWRYFAVSKFIECKE